MFDTLMVQRTLGATLLLLLAASTSACVTKREPVRALPVGAEPSSEASGPRIVVEAFTDRRGEEAVRGSVTRAIPVVNLVHMGETYFLPEQSAAIASQVDGSSTVVTGALERDLPYHLARMLPAEFARAGDSADFQILGSIKESALEVQLNIVPGFLLSIVGVPYAYTSFDLRWTMTVIHCGDRENPVIEKTYDYSGRQRTGAYYGAMAARKLLIAGMAETIAEARTDIHALAAAAGPCDAAEPPPVQASQSATKRRRK